jgi:general secretion pathway protein F
VVVPQFKSIFQDMELPLITKAVVFFGESINNYWWVLLILIGCAVGWWMREVSTVEGRLRVDTLKLRIPLLGSILQKIAVSKMAFALSLLSGSGVSLLTSLGIAGKIMGNECLARALTKVEQEVKQGNTVSKGMAAQGVFPVLAVEMIGIGEESGKLGVMLDQVATAYDGDVKHSLSLFMTAFEPLLILVMVGVIGILAAAILLPVITMNSSIG